MLNRLADEGSLYLRQHADNPVDWHPWGEEALQRAREEDKPIFLSIGYSACHWCHVMAHESFEDQAVAAFLNEHFVAIKVDREERPELDHIYMSAVQSMTGRGGWPLSVFLTPAGHPFYGGTYFPPQARYGMPSFFQVLRAVLRTWQQRRDAVVETGQNYMAAVERQLEAIQGGDPEACMPETLDNAYQGLRQGYDHVQGGWGEAPKFPQPMVLEFLLRRHHSTEDSEALSMVTHALEAMARGGIYDQLGGGFHRYSVDAQWLVPHFEKMLYDNALLARVYLHAWQVTGSAFFRTIAEEILDYVKGEMVDPAGGFYSTQDADSEGEEGTYYLWSPEEIRQVLGEEAQSFTAAYGVTEGGNFEGRNILFLAGDPVQRAELEEAREKLLQVRSQRVPPGRDEKVQTSWNGLMLAAFAEAARVLERDDYRLTAERNAAFLLDELRREGGRLYHVWAEGRPKVNGILEDYTHLAEGLIELYQTTFERRWYDAARELVDAMITHFAHPQGTFYDTSDDHEDLIVRPRELQDSAVPSGNAMAATVLLRLAGLAAEPAYAERACRSLSGIQPLVSRFPLGFGQWLQALSYALSKPREIAIIGEPEGTDTRALLDVVRRGYHPFQVAALGAPAGQSPSVPLLRDRGLVRGQAAAYVCQSSVCQAPITDPQDLLAQLGPLSVME